MSTRANSEAKSGTLIQRVTQIFTKKKAEETTIEAVAVAVETEEQKQERLDAYRKFCEEQSKQESENGNGTGAKKEFKFRAPDFNR